MVLDRISRFRKIFPSPELRAAADFIESLGPDTADGEYPLVEGAAFARVMTYQSRPRKGSLYEAHRQYADIQILLSGVEEIDWAPLEGLAVAEPFDTVKDAALYATGGENPTSVVLVPGLFAVFYPWDAHMPQLMRAGGPPVEVRKVVVKVRAGLLSGLAQRAP